MRVVWLYALISIPTLGGFFFAEPLDAGCGDILRVLPVTTNAALLRNPYDIIRLQRSKFGEVQTPNMFGRIEVPAAQIIAVNESATEKQKAEALIVARDADVVFRMPFSISSRMGARPLETEPFHRLYIPIETNAERDTWLAHMEAALSWGSEFSLDRDRQGYIWKENVNQNASKGTTFRDLGDGHFLSNIWLVRSMGRFDAALLTDDLVTNKHLKMSGFWNDEALGTRSILVLEMASDMRLVQWLAYAKKNLGLYFHETLSPSRASLFGNAMDGQSYPNDAYHLELDGYNGLAGAPWTLQLPKRNLKVSFTPNEGQPYIIHFGADSKDLDEISSSFAHLYLKHAGIESQYKPPTQVSAEGLIYRLPAYGLAEPISLLIYPEGSGNYRLSIRGLEISRSTALSREDEQFAAIHFLDAMATAGLTRDLGTRQTSSSSGDAGIGFARRLGLLLNPEPAFRGNRYATSTSW